MRYTCVVACPLKDKVIAITGAGARIASATAVACTQAGMRATLAARRYDRLREVWSYWPFRLGLGIVTAFPELDASFMQRLMCKRYQQLIPAGGLS